MGATQVPFSPFNPGETIVYAKHGVGVIENIVQNQFHGENYLAYAIKIKASSIELFVPVESAEQMGLRKLKNEADMEKALNIIASSEEISELTQAKTWKERKKILDELFRKGTPEDLAKIIKFLYIKNKQKDLPNSERKIYESSFKFLVHELSEVKNISEEEADHLITEKLTNNY